MTFRLLRCKRYYYLNELELQDLWILSIRVEENIFSAVSSASEWFTIGKGYSATKSMGLCLSKLN
jgi:hypothetical protein